MAYSEEMARRRAAHPGRMLFVYSVWLGLGLFVTWAFSWAFWLASTGNN